MKNAAEQKVKPQQTEGHVFVTYGGTASSRPHSGASVVNEGIRSLRHCTYRRANEGQALLVLERTFIAQHDGSGLL